MKAGAQSGPRRLTDLAAVAARWAMGVLFVWMGLNKALEPVEFLKLVREYDLTQSPLLLNSIAAMLPWFEVFCGLLLLSGVAVRGAAMILLAMLVPFTIVVLQRALDLQETLAIPFCAVKFDCGCGAGEVFICRKLVENGVLALLAAWLVAGSGRQLAARYQLLQINRSSAGS